MFARFDVSNLTQLQLDGATCVVCGDEDGAMIPVGAVEGGQVFAHRPCVEERPAPKSVLVVGDTSTSAALDDLTAFASDVADRLGFPVLVAIGRDYRPEDFEGVVLADGWATSYDSAVLGCEAMLADVYCVWSEEVYRHPIIATCGLCGDVDPEAAPVAVGGGWSVSLCPACAPAATRPATLEVVA
ncbi:hypothetical protein ACH4F6_27050 [Streptomyces sp. NPDC017936]|uniref:hypothetical protein n=1 Tax=Streptomyces sp. NPDC017936 TaxID=3365016 RepID=UPI0037A76097